MLAGVDVFHSIACYTCTTFSIISFGYLSSIPHSHQCYTPRKNDVVMWTLRTQWAFVIFKIDLRQKVWQKVIWLEGGATLMQDFHWICLMSNFHIHSTIFFRGCMDLCIIINNRSLDSGSVKSLSSDPQGLLNHQVQRMKSIDMSKQSCKWRTTACDKIHSHKE